MKKPTLLLLGILFAFSLSAQNIKLGIKAGANFTSLKSNQKWLNSESSSGYLIGAWGRIGGDRIHLQPEFYFTNKQTSIYIKDATEDLVKGDLKFNNIDIPLLIGTKIPIGPFKARVVAGPLFSFIIDEKASFKKSIDNVAREALKNHKNNFSAIVGGVGFDLGKIALDVRYEYGLGNISKAEDRQSLKIWSVGLGYSFL